MRATGTSWMTGIARFGAIFGFKWDFGCGRSDRSAMKQANDSWPDGVERLLMATGKSISGRATREITDHQPSGCVPSMIERPSENPACSETFVLFKLLFPFGH